METLTTMLKIAYDEFTRILKRDDIIELDAFERGETTL